MVQINILELSISSLVLELVSERSVSESVGSPVQVHAVLGLVEINAGSGQSRNGSVSNSDNREVVISIATGSLRVSSVDAYSDLASGGEFVLSTTESSKGDLAALNIVKSSDIASADVLVVEVALRSRPLLVSSLNLNRVRKDGSSVSNSSRSSPVDSDSAASFESGSHRRNTRGRSKSNAERIRSHIAARVLGDDSEALASSRLVEGNRGRGLASGLSRSDPVAVLVESIEVVHVDVATISVLNLVSLGSGSLLVPGDLDASVVSADFNRSRDLSRSSGENDRLVRESLSRAQRSLAGSDLSLDSVSSLESPLAEGVKRNIARVLQVVDSLVEVVVHLEGSSRAEVADRLIGVSLG